MIRIKSGALSFVVGISIVFAIMIGSALLVKHYSDLKFVRNKVNVELLENVNSGIEILKSHFSNFHQPTIQIVDLFGEGKDSVVFNHQPWGLIHLAKITAKRGRKSFSKIAFLGQKTFSRPSLYLADSQNKLTLLGRSSMEGVCFVPKSEITIGRLSGQYFTGSLPPDNLIYNSNQSIPDVNDKLINSTEVSKQNTFPISRIENNYSNSFTNETGLYYSDNRIVIQQKIYGNVIIESRESIEVTVQAKLTDVLLIAPKIIIRDFVSGSFQAIAQDTILVGSGVRLDYPTVLATTGNNKSLIDIKSGSISGSILMYTKSSNENNLLQFRNPVNFHGMIYTNGYVSLNGNFLGSVITQRIIFNQFGEIRENNLLNTSISSFLPEDPFLGIGMLSDAQPLGIMKWLK